MQKFLYSSILILTIFSLIACQAKEKTITNNSQVQDNSSIQQEKTKLKISVSILPQKYFVEKIAGDLVSVNVMVQPGIEAETYEPLPQDLVKLSDSIAYILINVPFEDAWLEKISATNPKITFINSGEGIEKIAMTGHDHDHNHTEDKETLDPHIWLSPTTAKIQAENIYQGLVKIDPKNQSIYQANLTQFLKEIDEVDRQIKTKLSNIKRREIIVYHPAWGYLTKEYNLTQIPLELEGQEVTSNELVELIDKAKKEKIKYVFSQPQFNNKTVETFAREINAEVITIDPLAENWSTNLLDTVDKIALSLQ